MGWLGADEVAYVRHILQRARLPVDPPAQMSGEDFARYMSVDKKVLDGTLRLVLMKSLGESIVTADFDPDALKRVLQG